MASAFENFVNSYSNKDEVKVAKQNQSMKNYFGAVERDFGNLQTSAAFDDPLKAAYSDALKRAAVKFGIARYLYSEEFGEASPQTVSSPAVVINPNILETNSIMINEDAEEWPHIMIGGLNHPVPECKNHAGIAMVQKSTRDGNRTFWGCPNYSTADCRYTYDHDKFLDETMTNPANAVASL